MVFVIIVSLSVLFLNKAFFCYDMATVRINKNLAELVDKLDRGYNTGEQEQVAILEGHRYSGISICQSVIT